LPYFTLKYCKNFIKTGFKLIYAIYLFCIIFNKPIKKATFAKFYGDFCKGLKGKNKASLLEGVKTEKMMINISKKKK
jgi:hypothetical protein